MILHVDLCHHKYVCNMHIVLLEIQNLPKTIPKMYVVGLEPSLIIDCSLYKMPFLK